MYLLYVYMTFRYNVLFFHPLGCVINCAFSRELKFQNKTEKKNTKKKKITNSYCL